MQSRSYTSISQDKQVYPRAMTGRVAIAGGAGVAIGGVAGLGAGVGIGTAVGASLGLGIGVIPGAIAGGLIGVAASIILTERFKNKHRLRGLASAT